MRFLSVSIIVFHVLFSLIDFSAQAQIATAQNTANDPRHETLNQRVVSVLFDNSIQSGSLTGWSVTVNGVAVTLNSFTILGTRVNIQFDASASHVGGEDYILPGDVVLVSYNAAVAGSNTLTAGSGLEINSFTNHQSKNNTAFSCSEMAFRQQGNY